MLINTVDGPELIHSRKIRGRSALDGPRWLCPNESVPAEPRFDMEAFFDEDYLHFYAARLDDGTNERDTDLIHRLLELDGGVTVLDVPCGHGRIANRLAERGCAVTGLDSSPLFLKVAREDAVQRGVEVDYHLGDMRDLPWRDRFDRAVMWFSSLGYFDDAGNRRVLEQLAGALRPGGTVLLDLHNRDWMMRNLQVDRVVERGDDLLIDRSRMDVENSRSVIERIVVRGGRVRRVPYFVRLFTFPELRDWLLAAGFAQVDAYGDDGGPLTIDSRRLIVTARV